MAGSQPATLPVPLALTHRKRLKRSFSVLVDVKQLDDARLRADCEDQPLLVEFYAWRAWSSGLAATLLTSQVPQPNFLVLRLNRDIPRLENVRAVDSLALRRYILTHYCCNAASALTRTKNATALPQFRPLMQRHPRS